MSISTTQHTQVLLVGAGPTGLTLATALAKYGIRVRLIEKKAALSRYTKATNLMQRNEEVLSALGLLEPMNEISGFCRRMMLHAYGKSFGPRTLRLYETPFQDILLCGQHNFEAVMAQGLGQRGVFVEFNTELKHLERTKESIRATVHVSDAEEVIECDYVVGCDGATGITRSFTKHDFTPQKTGVAIRQADCTLTWRRLNTMEQLWFFYFQHGFAVIIPLPGGIHRVLLIEPKANMPQRDPTLEELQTKLREVTNDKTITLSNPDWFSYTDLSMGIGSGLRDGRIILAGDVGNPILPNGGQGMNTGISDAFNLGWKLACVLNNNASEALLNTYEQERHALRRDLQTVQYNSLKYTTLITPTWIQTLIRWLGNPLLNRGGEYRMAQAFSELSLNTRTSPLTCEMMGKKGVRAGDRVRDADLVKETETIKLYDLLYAGGWTVLAFTGTKEADIQETVDAMNSFERPDLAQYIVSTHSQITSHVPVLYDLDEVAHRVYGVMRPTLYLLRPDGYVGARVSPRHVGQLKEYAKKWIPMNALAPIATSVR